MESTDYLKVQPKKFAPRTQEETSEGKFWKRLRFLESQKQVCNSDTSYRWMLLKTWFNAWEHTIV